MQKVSKKWIGVPLLILFLGTIGIMYYQKLLKLTTTEGLLKKNESLVKSVKDSLDLIKYANHYLNTQFDINFSENNSKYDIRNVKLFTLSDGKPKYERVFGSLSTKKKKKLVIRYTEIGCNSCSDSTIRAISNNESLRNAYDILFMVDFSNYDSYLKWRKITQIRDSVFWVGKGSLPFTLERLNDSYAYTIDENSHPDNFFVPNSRFPFYINAYLDHISRKL